MANTAELDYVQLDPVEDETRPDEEDPNVYRYRIQFPLAWEVEPDERYNRQEMPFRLLDSLDLFREVTDGVENKWIGGDTETDGFVYGKNRICGFSFAFDKDTAFYVPLRHVAGKNCGAELPTSEDGMAPPEVWQAIFDFHYRNKWLYYHWMFDGLMWKYDGMDVRRVKVRDVLAWIFNADSNIKQNNLKWSAKVILGRTAPTFEDTVGKEEITFDRLRPEEALFYAASDAANTIGVYDRIWKALLTEYARWAGLGDWRDITKIPQYENLSVFLDSRLACAMVEYYLENPIYIDQAAMAELGQQLRDRRDELSHEIWDLLGCTRTGEFVSLRSKEQLGEALWKMGLDTGERTETGRMKVDKKCLAKVNHPVGKALVEYSSVDKQLNSYVSKLAEVSRGRINYGLFAAPTGRLTSGKEGARANPYFLKLNIQNLTKPKTQFYKAEFEGDDPSRTDLILGWRFTPVDDAYKKAHPEERYVEGFHQKLNIRRAITVPDGNTKDWYFVPIDFKQEELVIIGAISKDPVYLNAFRTGRDLYRVVAAQMFNTTYEAVTSAQRKKAKIAVLGLNYGGSAFTLMNATDELTREEAQEIVDKYRATVHHLEWWKQQIIAGTQTSPRERGTVRTPYGRPRRVMHWLGSNDPQLRERGKRLAINHIIQGCAADVMRILLVELHEKLFRVYPDDIKFVSCVHDEVDVVVRKSAFHALIPQVVKIMQIRPPGCDLTLEADVSVGWNYGHNFKFAPDASNVWTPG